jgi:hypothetical protein
MEDEALNTEYEERKILEKLHDFAKQPKRDLNLRRHATSIPVVF